MVQWTIDEAEASPNGVWMSIEGHGNVFISNGEIARGYIGTKKL
jgi:hypothetical protein